MAVLGIFWVYRNRLCEVGQGLVDLQRPGVVRRASGRSDFGPTEGSIGAQAENMSDFRGLAVSAFLSTMFSNALSHAMIWWSAFTRPFLQRNPWYTAFTSPFSSRALPRYQRKRAMLGDRRSASLFSSTLTPSRYSCRACSCRSSPFKKRAFPSHICRRPTCPREVGVGAKGGALSWATSPRLAETRDDVLVPRDTISNVRARICAVVVTHCCSSRCCLSNRGAFLTLRASFHLLCMWS